MGLTSDDLVRGDSVSAPQQHDLRDSIVGTTTFDLHGVTHVVHAFTDGEYLPPDCETLKIELDGFGIVYTCGTFLRQRSMLTAVNDSVNELITASLRATEQLGFVKDDYKNCLPEAEHRQVQNSDGTWDISAVDELPEFPGGYDKLLQHMTNIQQYPDSESKAGIEGTVYVRFIIKEDGSLTHIEILRKISPGLDKEAIRLIESMPNWTPAEIKGHAVRVRAVLPIHFKLEASNQ